MDEKLPASPTKPSIVGPVCVGILIGVVICGLGFYFWNQSKTTTPGISYNSAINTPKPVEATPANSDSNTVTSPTTTTAPISTPTSIAYLNDQYGFSMTLPQSWKAYKIKTLAADGVVAYLYFEMPTIDDFPASSSNDLGYFSPFALGVYTPSQWTTIEAEGGPIPTVVSQTSKYVFTWSHANGMSPSDWTLESDIKSIIASFKTS